MAKLEYDENGRLLFTKEMQQEYTILAPQMAAYHFEFFESIFKAEGYKFKVLKTANHQLIHEGMKYVHNDTCVPALFVIGQFIDAIKNGGYDDKKVALMITQTGGGCRASNYIHLLRKALKKCGYEHVPVVSFNVSNLEENPGFKLDIKLTLKLMYSAIVGDVLMQLANEVVPYEINKGDTDTLLEKWNEKLRQEFSKPKVKWKIMKKQIALLVKDFEAIPVDKSVKKPKIGVVGEIYVKFSPLGNNNLEQFLKDQGCEVVVPSLMDFVMYTVSSMVYDIDNYGGSKIKKAVLKYVNKNIEKKRDFIRKQLLKTKFHVPIRFEDLKELAKGYTSQGNHMGEGWLLTAEMVELIKMGVPNIVCTQPFGCLPNHISGKGMMKRLKEVYPDSNIVPIDFDTSASEINQVNRIKLMIANAERNLAKNK